MTGDPELVQALNDMWQRVDPPPADLADRVLFTLELEDIDFELMSLAASMEPADVRGEEQIRTVTFTDERLTVILVLPSERTSRRVDGWLSPRSALRVELRTQSRSWHTTADVDGRFAFNDVPNGLGQLVIRPTPGAAVDLAVTLVTPSIWV
jgi:hypothetical protein